MAGVSAQNVEPKAGLPYSSWRRSVAQYWFSRSRSVHSCVPGSGSPAGPTQSKPVTGSSGPAYGATCARAIRSACPRSRRTRAPAGPAAASASSATMPQTIPMPLPLRAIRTLPVASREPAGRSYQPR